MEIEPTFIQDIRLLLRQARQQAYSAVNSAMVEAYWNIGRRIVEEEQKGSERAGYGEGLIKELSRQLTGEFGKRLLTSPDKHAALAHQAEMEKESPRDFIKDPYVFEFLDIPEPYRASEKEIEAALIENLQAFLLELGKGFSFVGRQFRISTETSHFYVDLVFYNYLLKCFALFDLKTGALTPQDIGQMDMYVRMFDDLKRGADDNPTIGIILCTEKSQTVVKYSILGGSEQLFATKYRLYLPTEEELIAEIEREKRLIREQMQLQGGKIEADNI